MIHVPYTSRVDLIDKLFQFTFSFNNCDRYDYPRECLFAKCFTPHHLVTIARRNTKKIKNIFSQNLGADKHGWEYTLSMSCDGTPSTELLYFLTVKSFTNQGTLFYILYYLPIFITYLLSFVLFMCVSVLFLGSFGLTEIESLFKKNTLIFPNSKYTVDNPPTSKSYVQKNTEKSRTYNIYIKELERLLLKIRKKKLSILNINTFENDSIKNLLELDEIVLSKGIDTIRNLFKNELNDNTKLTDIILDYKFKEIKKDGAYFAQLK